MAPRIERRQKPLTERKRRARINKCLEQLKDVVIDNNGGILPRLDKARILELTVTYLKTLTSSKSTESVEKEKFKAGYLRCLNEVNGFLHNRTDDDTLNQVVRHLFTANIQSKCSSQAFKHCLQEQQPIKSFVSNSNCCEVITHNVLNEESVEVFVPKSNNSEEINHSRVAEEPIGSFVSNSNSSDWFKQSRLDQEPIGSFVSNSNSSDWFKQRRLDQEPIESFVSNSNSSDWFKQSRLDQEPIESFVSNSNISDLFKHSSIDQEPIGSFVSNSNKHEVSNECVYTIEHTLTKQTTDQNENISSNLFTCSNRYITKYGDSDSASLINSSSKSQISCEECSINSTDRSTNEKECCKLSTNRPVCAIDIDYWMNGGHSSRSYFSNDKTVNSSTASCQIIWRPW